MAVTKLWIEDGCTYCHLCESTAPDVFKLENEITSEVKEGAEQFFGSLESDIKDAADGCPVNIIKWEDSNGGNNV